MLEVGMYVRCAIDEDNDNPRDFICGQIVSVDTFNESVLVIFNDPYKYKNFYTYIPGMLDLPQHLVRRCFLFNNSVVSVNKENYRIVDRAVSDNWTYYYLNSEDNKKYIKVREDKIKAPFNIGSSDPAKQLSNYEFQNPCWYFGRTIVSKTMNILENSIYGFKELAGCKISLMPHQLKTIMRCLQEKECRYMLADEVGMGKTIEALSILKIYLSRKSNSNNIIIVPKPLLEQWRIEMFLKFNLRLGKDDKNNNIVLKAKEDLSQKDLNYDWDFAILDEVHKILNSKIEYEKLHTLSMKSENILLLSATPVQYKKNEYLLLLKLIMPDKYDCYNENKFSELINKQGDITKTASLILSDLEDYLEAIEEAKNEEIDVNEYEDCADLFDSIDTSIKKLNKILINDLKFKELSDKISFESDDFGVNGIQIAISYVCENYQIEKKIIRNRRKYLDDMPQRKLVEKKYELDADRNVYEYLTYKELESNITSSEIEKTVFEKCYMQLFAAFFSSAIAFNNTLEIKIKEGYKLSEELNEYAKKWLINENGLIIDINKVLNEPYNYSSRILEVIDYIDQEITNKEKVVLFTNFIETFNIYKDLLEEVFGADSIAVFNKKMNTEELEVNAYRFQNDEDCYIMICDEAGGEGRNFQCADYLIHIDLPWDANAIEQRIGRLDRIGREKNKDIVSVVIHSCESLEEELFKFWDKGLNIFNQSISGLEIIMGEINDNIISAIISDFKYGLSNSIDKIIDKAKEMENEIRQEQYFDTAAYLYKPMNQELIRLVRYYNTNENQLFAKTMMNWASLAGLNGHRIDDNIVSFNQYSFSPKSAKNSILIPPKWDEYMSTEQNEFTTKIKELYLMDKEQSISSDDRKIEGTFNRGLSIKNDYLHFFAPGDEIFDCIVNNAMLSSRGQSCSFAVKASINWEGIVFIWSIKPDEKILIDNNIPSIALSQYRNYLASDQIIIPISLKNNDNHSDITINEELNKIFKEGFIHNKENIAHLGKRSISEDFLKISINKDISNVEWFKGKFTSEKWKHHVSEATKSAKEEVRKKIKKYSNITGANEEISRHINSLIATADYYNYDMKNIDDEKHKYSIILESLKKPKFVLESAAFVWMVKN